MADQDNRNRGGSQLDNRDEMKSDGPDNRPDRLHGHRRLVLGIIALLASFFKEIGLVALCLGGLGPSAPCRNSSSPGVAVGTRGRLRSTSVW